MEQQKQQYRCFSSGRGFCIRIPVSESQEQQSSKTKHKQDAK
ncbi:MAG: hypothetical protein CENE_01292 [Candidatus Celerinatantimonas neptuna]|nr:MAG: hypothetical protein CENE_01292 [Candidatus Celerinatantimonas neptuna]